MFRSEIRPLLDKMISDPKKFSLDEFAFSYIGSENLSVWVGNGIFFYGLWKPREMRFKWSDKFRFLFALHKWKKNNIKKITITDVLKEELGD